MYFGSKLGSSLGVHTGAMVRLRQNLLQEIILKEAVLVEQIHGRSRHTSRAPTCGRRDKSPLGGRPARGPCVASPVKDRSSKTPYCLPIWLSGGIVGEGSNPALSASLQVLGNGDQARKLP